MVFARRPLKGGYLTKDADAVTIAEEVVRAAAAHHPLSDRRAA
jgi:hypothetical protein